MSEDYYDVWRDMVARTSRPQFRALLLDRAGVAIDAELAEYLVHIDLRGPIGVVALAELLDENHPKVSRTLARLEELGLITRTAATHDQRVKAASVTAKGHRIVAKIDRGRRRLLDEVFADWTARDQATLARLTRRFSDDMFALVDAHGAGRPR